MNDRIWNITPINLSNASNSYFTEKTYSIILKWLIYADKQYEIWPKKENCGHFFGGSYWYGLETAATAFVYAVLAKVGDYNEELTNISRHEVLNKAIAAVRYLGFTHDTGPADCVRAKSLNPHCSERKWGGAGDNFFQASQHGVTLSQFGLASWLLWNDLDDQTKLLVQNVLSSYADRWSTEKPRNGTYFDTQAEENGWTALGIAIAVAMFPNHSHAKLWKQKALEWLLCTCTTYLDRYNRNIYQGKPLAFGWINSITIHPDYTTENHGFVHPNYLSAGIVFGGHISLFNLLAGEEIVPNPFLHWDDIYNKALKVWTMYDGLTTPIQGQDWWYNQQSGIAVLHAYMNIFRKNRHAAALEKMALESVAKIQDSNKNGCLYEANGEECRITEFQTAVDMEHQAACGIAQMYLLHCFAGEGEAPIDRKTLNKELKGVYNYPYGNSIVYRTEDSLNCFSWRNCVMAITLPKKGMWTITAMGGSYIGTVKLNAVNSIENNTENSNENSKQDTACNNVITDSTIPSLTNEEVVRNVEDENIIPRTEGFSASVRIERGHKRLFQDAAFIALPDGKTVYFEKFTAAGECRILEMKTACIGVRNENYQCAPETAKGFRKVYLDDGTTETFKGYYGKDPDRIVEWDELSYINIDNEIGYIMFNNNSVEYVNKHQYPKWKGVEDILTLNKVKQVPVKMAKGDSLKPLIVITAPNYTFTETASLANKIHLPDNSNIGKIGNISSSNSNVSLLIVEDYLVYFNFEYNDILGFGQFNFSKYINSSAYNNGYNNICNNNYNDHSISLFKGYNRICNDIYTWEGDINKRESGWYKANFKIIGLNHSNNIILDVYIVSNHQAVFYNSSDSKINFRVEYTLSNKIYDIALEAGETYRLKVNDSMSEM